MVNDTQNWLNFQGMECDLPTSPYDLMKLLDQNSIKFTFYHHKPVFTVADSSEVDSQISGTHTRNLFLKDKKDKMFLVTLRHDTPLDLKKLEKIIGSGRLSFGSPERLWTYLGVRPGSVTPFAIINDKDHAVTPIWEAGMMAHDIVNFHPLLNSMTIGLTPNDLRQFATLINRDVQVLDLDAARPI
jgi:Ala-tRNA(Pro) deacylase